MRIRAIGILAAAALGAGAAPPAAAQALACGDVVTADVQLQADLVDCPGPGLVIGADGVDVDLNGHTLGGTRPGEGIGIDNSAGFDRISVSGGTVSTFARGVVLTGADDAILRGLTVTRNGEGVVASASDRLLIEHSSVLDNSFAMRQGVGIAVTDGSDDARIHQVVSSGSQGHAVRLVDAPRARVEHLIAEGNEDGVGVYRSPGSLVRGASVVGRNSGVSVTDSADTRVLDNVSSTHYGGISVSGSSPRTVVAGNDVAGVMSVVIGVSADQVRVEGNRVGPTVEDGIRVTGSRVHLRNNVVDGTFGDGILVTASATGAYLEGNIVSRAFADGIDIDTPAAVLRGNVAFGNGELGIEGVRGIKSRGWNGAWDNGDVRQCVYVRCRTKSGHHTKGVAH